MIMPSAKPTFVRTITLGSLVALFLAIPLVSQEAAAFANYGNHSIKGTYAVIGVEQGGGSGSGNPLLPEAAMGTITFDGAGNAKGFLTWNMPHPASPYPARLVLRKYPYTGAYSIDTHGFGGATLELDLSALGMGKLIIRVDLCITKATKEKVATEIHAIGKKLTSTGSLPIMKIQKREQ
jgi:hypothetical protein